MRAAHLYALRGDKERARREADLAASYFRTRTKADLGDQVARLGWADATTFLEKFADAVAILEDGWAGTREPVYRLAQARVYVAWFDNLARDSVTAPGLKLALLEKGLHCDPSSTDLLDRLLAVIKVQGSEAEKARATLHRLLAAGEVPATVHFALGIDALQHGETEQAALHWERANQLAPDLPIVANNLAWLIAQSPSPDLPRALDLVNMALKQAPDQPSFHHTRGHILVKMERWKEALGDLETALPRYTQDPETHRALALVYGHLGVPAMEAEHKRLAEIKKASNSSPATP
jgi:Flp pilus assembly protein TadD